LVAVDAEKLTMTSSRPPHKKLRQETQSTAALFKPSAASSGATACMPVCCESTWDLKTVARIQRKKYGRRSLGAAKFTVAKLSPLSVIRRFAL
jgi:hypothetical protein